MSQRHVEKLLGRLVLDEELRQRFFVDRHAALADLAREGVELTPVELDAVAAIEPRDLDRFAAGIDRRIHKASLANPAPLATRRLRENS
ncbi:MAG: Franean1_4349 family RiPP [bacterium]